MGAKTGIEWTDASWTAVRARNLKTGKIGWHCEHVTSGCEHCYSETLNKVYGTKLPFKPGHRKDIEIFLDEKMLLAPLRWKRPRMVFTCSMTDLFADFVKDEWIDRVFAVMALCPQHTFQILTKRPERMKVYMSDARVHSFGPQDTVYRVAAAMTALGHGNTSAALRHHWPLSNVWLGTSCEDQATADERIEHLRATRAAIRFISFEPLLGPINADLTGIHWAIIGGESGPRARGFDLAWGRSLAAQCKASGVACFVKQLGSRPLEEFAPGCDHFLTLHDRKGGDWSEWPQDLRVREFPEARA